MQAKLFKALGASDVSGKSTLMAGCWVMGSSKENPKEELASQTGIETTAIYQPTREDCNILLIILTILVLPDAKVINTRLRNPKFLLLFIIL